MKNFVVYRSSAGSGKTFTLVKDYLRLALYDEHKLTHNYRRILAITFTNKAAAEMKSRVIGALSEISTGQKPSFIGDLLCAELKIDRGALKRRAEVVLNSILHHYSDFAIGTIDSFTHKIVKTFAHDLELPVNFNIELDTRGFYDKVIASLLNQVGEDEYVSRLLKDFVLGKAENNNNWDPEKQIREFSALLLKEHADAYIQSLKTFSAHDLDNFRKEFNTFARHYQNTLRTEAQKALQLLTTKGLNDEDFKYKKSGPQRFFRICLNNTVTPADCDSSRLQNALTQNQWGDKKNAALESIIPELNRIGSYLAAFIKENYKYYSLCSLLANQMYSLMLLKKIEEISLEQKQEERLVFISEFNQKIFDIIHNEPTPFIYERLGERFHHYLLDEFQDTSSLQWQNILPLMDNSLAGGWFNLIVGDGKQSIYRWRNANVKQFASLPEIENSSASQGIFEREQSLKRNFEERVLSHNYRSLPAVVEFNNDLFAYLAENVLSPEASRIYDNHRQSVNPSMPQGGFVSINVQKVAGGELDQYTCNLVKEHILEARSGGFGFSDICILARKNEHGNTIAAYLVENNIPVVSSDSLLLKNNLEVNTLLCFLAYQLNNQDIISAAAVVNYLHVIHRISESELHRYLGRLSARVPLFEVLQSCGIQLEATELALANLGDNCITITRALELDKHAYHYIRYFLDEVNEFLVLKNSNVSGFLDWWQNRSRNASLVIPDGTNAVRIMTIHASKGLEFPVVIVPYCNWAVYKAGDSWVNIRDEQVRLPVTVVNLSKKAGEAGFDKELEAEQNEQLLDNINLLYVAFTRAVERLHIIAAHNPRSPSKAVNEWLEQFAKRRFQAAREGLYETGTAGPKIGKTDEQLPEPFLLHPLTFDTPGNLVRIKASYLGKSTGTENARQQGILLHWLLSKITSVKDIDAAIEQAMLEGLITGESVAALKNKLETLASHPSLKAYFETGVRCKLEAELISPHLGMLRPDRVVFSDDAITIIDYKTGQRNDKKYFAQLRKYEEALVSMGHTNLKKLLLYIDEMAIVEVN